MKIITWNINGLKSAVEKGDFNQLLNKQADIICLQEVKISDEEYIKSIIPSEYYIYINKAEKNGYSGVAILSKKKADKVQYKTEIKRFDEEGRYILLEFDKFILYNLYIPHGGRDKRNLEYKLNVCKEILYKLENNILNSKEIIVTTDFNIAHHEIDLARPKQNRKNIMFTEEERQIVDKILNIGFVDSFRYYTKEPGYYTWFPYAFDARNRNLGWRIDYIFVSNNLKKYIKSVKILKDIYGSDHCPTELILNIN